MIKLALIAFLAIQTSQSFANEFYSQEKFSKASLRAGAQEFLKKIDDADTNSTIEKINAGERNLVKGLFQTFLTTQKTREFLLSSAAITTSLRSDAILLSELEKALAEVLKKDVNYRMHYTIGLMTMVAVLGKDAKPLIPGMRPFLKSSNFHEVYWAIKALTSMRSASSDLQSEIIKLYNTPGTLLSVKRHILLYLGAQQSKISKEGLKILEGSLDEMLHPLRESGATALINLRNEIPESLQIKLLNLKSRSTGHVVEIAVFEALQSDDPNLINNRFYANQQRFVSSTANYLLEEYIKHIGARVNQLSGFFTSLLDHTNPDFQEYGARLILSVEDKLTDQKLVERARKLQ